MKRKRFVSILLALVLLVGTLPVMGVSAAVEGGDLGNGNRWELDRDTGVLTLVGTGELFTRSGNLAPWAKWKEEIRTVVIQEGITSVSYGAFSACQWVEEFCIPSTMEDVSYPPSRYLQAFHVAEGNRHYGEIDGVLFSADRKTLITMPRGYMGCYTVPNTVTTIESGAFRGCHGLMELRLPEGLTEIKSGTFADCSSLMAVSLPNSLKKIRTNAFENCLSLEEIRFPEGLTTLEDGAFEGSGLREVVIPDSVVKFGNAFNSCGQLETMRVGKGIGSRLEYVYQGTPRLKRVIVSPQNSVYSSDDKGVLYDKEKTELMAAPDGIRGEYTVPEGVTFISYDAFDGCSGLTRVYLPASLTGIGEQAFCGCTALEAIDIPSTVTWIGMGAFEKCRSLKEIQLPPALKELGDYAFADSGLTAVTVPEGYRQIPDGLFHDCKDLKRVSLPASIESIGSEAFAGCDSLRSLSVPGKNTEISFNAFGGELFREEALRAQGGLTALELSPENGNFTTDPAGAIYNRDMTYLYLVPASVEGTYGIAPACEGISPYAFMGATFHTLRIPKEMDRYDAFYDFYGPNIQKFEVEDGNPVFSADEQGALYDKEQTCLLRLPGGFQGAYYSPDGVSYTETAAFDGCKGLTEVHMSMDFVGMDFFMPNTEWIPKLLVPRDHPECINDAQGVLYSRDMAQLFYAPKDLEGVYTVPHTVGLIYSKAFENCTRLTAVDMSQCHGTTVGESTFAGCTALQWVKLPESIDRVYGSAFEGCTALTSVELPEGLEKIEAGAFYGCTALRNVTVPASVKEIDGAFTDCTGLRTVRFMGDIPMGFETAFLYSSEGYYIPLCLPKVMVEFSWEAKGFTAPCCCGIGTRVFSPTARNCTGEACGCTEFTDIPQWDHWAHNAIEELLDMGLVNGVGKNRFNPDGTMTRAMLVTILYRLEGATEVWKCPFTDVPEDTWYTEAVTWAGGMGIVQGYGDGRFAPTAPVTREQVATILARYLGIVGDGSGRGRASLTCFTDETDASDYARESLQRMVMEGIINGKGTKLDPKGTATRAEVCTILWRLLEFTEIS